MNHQVCELTGNQEPDHSEPGGVRRGSAAQARTPPHCPCHQLKVHIVEPLLAWGRGFGNRSCLSLWRLRPIFHMKLTRPAGLVGWGLGHTNPFSGAHMSSCLPNFPPGITILNIAFYSIARLLATFNAVIQTQLIERYRVGITDSFFKSHFLSLITCSYWTALAIGSLQDTYFKEQMQKMGNWHDFLVSRQYQSAGKLCFFNWFSCSLEFVSLIGLVRIFFMSGT